jgi:hypothetical protein
MEDSCQLNHPACFNNKAQNKNHIKRNLRRIFAQSKQAMKVHTKNNSSAAKNPNDSSKIRSNMSVIYRLLMFITNFKIINVYLGHIQFHWLSI